MSVCADEPNSGVAAGAADETDRRGRIDAARVTDRVVHVPGPDADGLLPVRSEDLAELVDIAGLILSPDATRVAFRTQSGSVIDNEHRAEWYVARTGTADPAVYIGSAGRAAIEDGFLEGALHNGGLNPVAAWSPDSGRLAFQTHTDTGFALCESGVNVAPVRLCELDGAVRALRYHPEGTHLLVRTSPPQPTPVRDPIDPGGGGILVGPAARFDAGITALGGPADEGGPADWAVDLATGTRRRATAAETAVLDGDPAAPPTHLDLPGNPLGARLCPNRSRVAYIDHSDDPGRPNLYVTSRHDPVARRLVTAMPASVTAWTEQNPILWWSCDGTTLYFQARGQDRDLGLYRVALRSGRPCRISPDGEHSEHRIDSLRGIAVGLAASLTHPPEVVTTDLHTGATRRLTDANPRWRSLRAGRIRRIEVDNDYGDRTWAHLVEPPAYRAGQRLPMVVTTYTSRGFLRGASGDEYPIRVLADRGFLVLDLEHPREYEIEDPGTGQSSTERFEAMYADMAGPLSSLQSMIEVLDRDEILDRGRIGICGFSHGSDIATYALESSVLFRAAVLSGFSHDDDYTHHLYGPGFDERWREWGLDGGPHGPNGAHWRRRSPGAEHITAAVLDHDTHGEYLASVSAYTRMVRAGAPVEMHVYPREDHVKIEPRHRLEVYRRTVDWFDFWLRDVEDPVPEKSAQYRRWRDLRAAGPETGREVSS